MYTSRNFKPWSTWRWRAASRSARYGETRVTSVMTPPALKRHATSPTRRTDSARSAGVKVKSRLSPVRTLSPSSIWTCLPCLSTSSSSSARAMVDLPDPESPVIQSVTPFSLSAAKRSAAGRWHASCEPPSPASAHSMMFGGVAANAASRYDAMSNGAGSKHAAEPRLSTYTTANRMHSPPAKNWRRLNAISLSAPAAAVAPVAPIARGTTEGRRALLVSVSSREL
mmetsp:Transcript_1424/g.5523  ORF Transcript_1424/g.5523 Transcript_1424/m.5523 type:complete len:226 (+) Transcript_1424:639-1316(+)